MTHVCIHVGVLLLHPQGLMGAANEVAFTCDSRRLLGAGADKRLLVWNTATGQVRYICGCMGMLLLGAVLQVDTVTVGQYSQQHVQPHSDGKQGTVCLLFMMKPSQSSAGLSLGMQHTYRDQQLLGF